MPYYHDRAENEGAVKAINQDPREIVPSEMRLKDSDEKWSPKRDLLGSDRFAAEFVVEIESDGSAQLRFGDDVSGKKPSSGSTMLANYRVGNGREGNIGPESIGRVVWEQDGIKNVRNPISATGGKDAETMEEVRQFAPQAFRTQKRAVTEDDYEQMAEQHEEVHKAAAMFRWTGSWYTVFIAIDRKGGYEVDENFKETIRRHLGQYRLAGYDLEINGPIFISLDLYLTVCVQPGYFQSDVKKTLFEVFSRYDLNNGKRGFFHPDNFTFGQPVYLSQIYMHAMGVTGVASVIVDKLQRWRKLPNKEKEKGVLTPSSIEIVRLDNDPNFQENGKIDFKMYGGL
jgi:predicted phage baseplate assembly protein